MRQVLTRLILCGAAWAFLTGTTALAVEPRYGPGNNVPEAADYTLLCSLKIPDSASYNSAGVPYHIDHRAWLSEFRRVAYYMELQQGGEPVRFIWVSMDAFSPNAGKLGVPAAGVGAGFTQSVTNLNVFSSVPGITNGTGLGGGTIDFRSADSGVMRIQSAGSGQTLFAFNHWGDSSAGISLGIGSNPPAGNAASYDVKRFMAFVLPNANPAPVDADIVVYGGTSGGVVAAVQAARMGKRVALVCQDNHIGGLSSGGLGWTDIGPLGSSYVGGLAREFYQRNGARYGQSVRFNLEPRVAEQIFGELLVETGVRVFFNRRLASVAMAGRRITQAVMEDGAVYRGKMFVDTTYEGDLMAAAGVSFTLGREGTTTYGESLAGMRSPVDIGIDPYVEPGNPASGLLPLMQPGDGGTVGAGDHRVQTYCYRLAFSQTAANRLPVLPPENYDPSRFELLARHIERLVARNGSVALGNFMTLDRPFATAKYDINNNGDVSINFVGESWTWGTNSYAARAVIRKEHEDYMRGVFTFLATSPRVPSNVRTAMQSWGLCRDEFLDTGGWPHALYIREARRMVGDYVMLQQDCMGGRVAPDGIALGAYWVDSHQMQRIAKNGTAHIEGGLWATPPRPFPVGYRSIVPRVGECENVLCTFALSASHVAFGSCRMEPVFMMTSQAAATAAALAIDANQAVQDVPYARLKERLAADKQVLQHTTPAKKKGKSASAGSDNTPEALAKPPVLQVEGSGFGVQEAI